MSEAEYFADERLVAVLAFPNMLPSHRFKQFLSILPNINGIWKPVVVDGGGDRPHLIYKFIFPNRDILRFEWNF